MSDPITTKPDVTPFSHMTPEQQEKAETIIDAMVMHINNTINRLGPEITALDKRPKKVWSPEDPNVFFPYVRQNMLEVLIERLQGQV